MTRTLLTAIFLTLFSQTVWGETSKLSKEENRSYARSCFNLVVHDAFRLQKFDLSNGYSYWPSTIENIDSSGADISTIIELKRQKKSGGNNGWGQETTKEVSRYAECIFTDVAKGNFPEPDYFLYYFAKGEVSRLVKQSYFGLGDGASGGSCVGQSRLTCKEAREDWFDVREISGSYEESSWGDRSAPFYGAAKSRAPNQQVLNWSFD